MKTPVQEVTTPEFTRTDLSLIKLAIRRFTVTDEPSRVTSCLLDELLLKVTNFLETAQD